jgi:hypothetical protein
MRRRPLPTPTSRPATLRRPHLRHEVSHCLSSNVGVFSVDLECCLLALLPSAEILKIWRKHQVEFIQAVSVHPDITSLDFQKKLLKATVFETCCAIVEDPQDDRTALLFALGLLKRMTSQDGAISVELMICLCGGAATAGGGADVGTACSHA